MPLSFPSSFSGVAASPHEHGQVLSLKRTERFVWHLRDDVQRAILCEVGEAEQAVLRLWLLHPTEAVALALFNGERSVEDVERALQYLFDLDGERACALTGKVVSRWSEALGPASEQISPRRGRTYHVGAKGGG